MFDPIFNRLHVSKHHRRARFQSELMRDLHHFQPAVTVDLERRNSFPHAIDQNFPAATRNRTESGFTAFICWTFQPQHTVLKIDNPTGVAEYLRTQALSRIFLDNIENIQSSWVTQGPGIGQIALKYGANDFGSVMMEENVVSSAGTTFRLNAAQIESLIRDAGYEPRRRNNWYELLN